MTFNQYLSRTAVAIAFCVFAPALLVIYVDPFQIFHKSYLANMGLIDNQRFQNAGLINSYLMDPGENYDSVMIGSSVSTNFTSQSASTTLGWKKSLRLFMNGGDPSQLALILNRALATQKVQHVLWEIPPRAYSPPRYFVPKTDWGFPDYLYNNNALDDLRYVFNYDLVKFSWTYLVHPEQRPTFTPESLDYQANNPLADMGRQNLNSAANLHNLQSAFKNSPQISEQEKNTDGTLFEYPALDQAVFPILEAWCNTDTEFVLFIPPISKIDYLGNPRFVFRSIYMVNAIVKKIENCHNMRLHAFDTMSFTGDLNNYADKMHYRLPVSEKILDLMARHENTITRENFEKYKTDFIHAVDNYQVYSSYSETNPAAGR